MSFKVVNTFALPGLDFGYYSELDPAGIGVEEYQFGNSEWRDKIVDADAVVTSLTHLDFDEDVFASLRQCRIVASFGIGFGLADLEAASARDIVVTNVPDYCLDEVSGRALALMLSLAHRLPVLDRMVREQGVCFLTNRPALLEVGRIPRMRDQTLGIIGFGKIGTVLAQKARGLGMRVIAHDPYVLPGVPASQGVSLVGLDELLAESDYVSLHTPLTEETKHLIGPDEFGLMRPTAYFVNTARGQCVSEDALVDALERGLIAGAGLDVTENEPLGEDSPLRSSPNVILTGHSAGYSEIADTELWAKPMTQVARVFRGEWPPYAINPEVRTAWLRQVQTQPAESPSALP